ncbi:TRAP transporter substrate-binding protein DctP [Aquisalimonas sp. 2447]|uniref:TRAP transporter substrate-binding protein DctP n=1 Tax=Aquisalimonas sp. 2447 TaxID=2740807 RepID=UPI001C2BA4FB|nr:TRAP transporter substrate-binding protein DctP [Aquisalimonas sp. 2447]
MKQSFKFSLSIATAGFLAASVMPAQVMADDTITWRVQSHWPSASSSYGDSLETLRDLLDERTDGRLQLELHEAGSLFGHDEIFSAVSRGVLDMGTISPAYERDRLSLAGIVYGLPNAFQDTWEAAYYYKQMGIEEMIQEEAAEYDVFYAIEKVYPTEMVLTEIPESVDDYEGMNIRSSGLLQSYLSETGAAASMIPGEELYQSLQTGVVDGAHWGAVQGALSMSLYEVAPYHVRPPLNIGGIDAYVISEDSLEELPEDIRETVKNTIEEQFWRRTNEYIYLEERALAMAKAEHGVEVIELPDEVQQRMLETAETMWEEEADESEMAAEAVEIMRELLTELGHLDG